ncbi:MAG: ABC transporter permease [Gammaproteobacteria bacterium]|nr:ABC transporter permease [Gammaproteobacteria bacterium]
MSILSRISAITFKEFKQLSRDKLTFGMVVMIPLIQLLLFGYAINTNVRNIPAGIYDESQTFASRSIAAAVAATQVVNFIAVYDSVQAAEQSITNGEVRAVLVLPRDLDQRLAQSQLVACASSAAGDMEPRALGQWLVDGSDTIVASTIRGLRTMPLTELSRGSALPPAPTFEVALYFNPEQRTAVNIVPGLLAIILTMTMILFTSTAIVRERERGNLELLITTPVHSLELMLGKIIPYILIGLIQMTIILGLGHLVFNVPINGEISQIVLATMLFIAASLTLGLIISTIAQTQLQAMQMTVFILLPSILLSGFMFPYEGMPQAAQWVAEVLPTTHFLRIIRGVVLRGASIENVQDDALFLIGFTVIGLLIAALKFKKRLD